ncbi:NAD(P)H-hydrate dehydratase [uncultured Friedmanniella sp.]|uniref:NAD(P)H-hydrate dehydratase n=1 Tax=uncultured Friedmanniella sp. TaxID=335381 RepID=UPI0035CBCED7
MPEPDPSPGSGSVRSGPTGQEVTPSLLRRWGLPAAGESKYGRGQVLIVGGAATTPGAVQLAGLAALRMGAGHLTMAVAASAAVPMAVATPEAGVIGLPQNERGSVLGADLRAIADDLSSADVVTVGVGLDDPEETAVLLRTLVPQLGEETWLVLDAYALGVLPGLDDEVLAPVRGRLVLTPNSSEAARLLDRELAEGTAERQADVSEIARRYGAVVSCSGAVANADGEVWQVSAGNGGLATSGSGDVQVGAVSGLLGRAGDADQAAVWGTHVHAAAGDRLAARVGALGFLARELLTELPVVLSELGA